MERFGGNLCILRWSTMVNAELVLDVIAEQHVLECLLPTYLLQ